MNRIITILIILFFTGICQKLYPQNYWSDTVNVLKGRIVGTDTMPNIDIKEIKVFPKKTFKNNRERRQYTRLIYNVKKAYPFAIIARNEFKKVNDTLKFIKTEKEQKEFLKNYEKQLFKQYEDDLQKLTFTQGRIMLKLVYREINITAFSVIKDYRGSVSAVFWQGIARIFKSNLKSIYDPYGEDADIEQIIQMIEAGVI